jgi:DNA-binding NarL/FixJ family response regulator
MPILLAIDNDAASRRSLLAAVPDDWTVLQAATGVEALDLVPQWGLQFSVVLVDPQLPDLDGVLVCAQLRILLPSLPIVPVTKAIRDLPILAELGCLPPLIKPVSANVLAQHLATALATSPPQPQGSAMLRLIYEQAVAAERRVRQGPGPLRALLCVSSPIKRAGLGQVLSRLALTEQVAHAGALQHALAHAEFDVLVIDASDYPSAIETLERHHVPIILIAATMVQVLTVPTRNVLGVILENDAGAEAQLHDLLERIRTGGEQGALLGGASSNVPWAVPPFVFQRLAHARLSEREIEVLWLDSQGFRPTQIAGQLHIERATVNSHWKRAQRRLGFSRPQLRRWLREQLGHEETAPRSREVPAVRSGQG